MTSALPSGWTTLAWVSLLFFLVTATTFTSLGVVLPSMVAELGWSWRGAGLGFSLLGVSCGITSTIPARLIRRFGVRATLGAGTAVMLAAFLCLARTQGLALYCFACGLAGLGFTLLATVPGTYLLARCFARPALPFGIYFTIGGLGGVAGPLGFLRLLSVTGNWRDYWLAAAACMGVAGLLAAVSVDVTTDVQAVPHLLASRGAASAEAARPVFRSEGGWTVAAALRTPQFAVLAAAYATFLLCGITVNSISVAHLVQFGASATLAGGLLSLEALINAIARTGGGALGDIVEPKTLLALSLLALIIGILALAFAHGPALMLTYAAGIGIGYGLTFFASTILLLNYFGAAVNLELFALVNLIATAASVGPFLAGWSHDAVGSFVPVLLGLAAFVAAILAAVLLMRPPVAMRTS
jgi:MFS family permease